jgi:two-component system, NarL family, response regulator NreC
MRMLRIVLVDDHNLVRDGLRMLLGAQADMEVIAEADNGRTAIALTQELRPDVVVMDISMSELSGLKATERLTESCPTSHIVVLTRHSGRAYVRASLEAGARGLVLKQGTSDELLHAIRAVAAGKTFLGSTVAEHLVRTIGGRRTGRRAATDKLLSEREEQVLRLVASGLTNKEVAARLDISTTTAESHKVSAMKKLALTTRIDINRYALLKGWLDDEYPGRKASTPRHQLNIVPVDTANDQSGPATTSDEVAVGLDNNRIAAANGLSEREAWSGLLVSAGPRDHIVQLYHDQQFLNRAVCRFAASGIHNGEGVILVPTADHWNTFRHHLEAEGVDTRAAQDCGQLTVVDADELLPLFMRDGMPNPPVFLGLAADLIARARGTGRYPKVRWWGEMVNILWERGDVAASMALEDEFDRLAHEHEIAIFCSFAMDNFSDDIHSRMLPRLGHNHSHLIPVEDYARLERAVADALRDVVGDDSARVLQRRLLARAPSPFQMPRSQALLLALRDMLPVLADSVLTRSRNLYWASMGRAG